MTNQPSADFPFESHFATVNGSKMHYIDEGQGDPILFLHGNPTSSYLWRNVIPHLTTQGRCIAPDLIGMGKSDKPDIEYRIVDHVAYLEGLIAELGLTNITLVIHDWGSALGFHYAMRHQENVKGIVFMEALIMPASWDNFPDETRGLFQAFRTPEIGQDLLINQNIFIEKVLPNGVMRPLTDAEMTHYRAPFLDPAHRTPLWRFPNEIPIDGDPADTVAMVANYNQKLQQSDLPKLLIHATPGVLVPPPLVGWCQQFLPNLQTVDIGAGLHFIQEDHPDAIGQAIAEWMKNL